MTDAALRRRVATLVLALLASIAVGRRAVAQGAAPEPQRWYELELPADGEPPLVPLTHDALAERLAENGYDGVVLRFPLGDTRGGGVPAIAPSALLMAPDAAVEPLRSLMKAYGARSLQVAVGWRRSQRIDDLTGAGPQTIHRGASAPQLDLSPASRPTARSLHWLECAAAPRDVDLCVSSDLLLRTAPELRATQAEYDIAAFGRRTFEVAPVLFAQSRLASAITAHLAGGVASAMAPLENEWLAEPHAERLPPLRRAPAVLDLEEWCFSFGANGRPEIDTLRATGTTTGHPFTWPELPSLLELLPAAANDRAKPGELGATGVRALAELLAARVATMHDYARWLIRAAPDAKARVLAGCAAQREQLALLLPALADTWRETLDLDEALVRDGEPWRVHRREWSVACAVPSGWSAPGPITTEVIDDPRLGRWRDHFAPPGAERIDLWSLVGVVAPDVRVTLTTGFSLRDPRNVRLRVAAAAARTVKVNGTPVVLDFAAERGPLLTTVSIPSGRSELTLELTLDGSAADLELALDLLPQRTDGIVIDATSASRVEEPAVRIGDPSALNESSIVRPTGRRGAGDGLASFPLHVSDTGRFDAWVHLLGSSDPGSTVTLALDGSTARTLELPRAAKWQWVRAAAPLTIAVAGDHSLQVRFATEGVRLDTIVLLPIEIVFPRVPDGAAPLWTTAWRFDPLGAGLVVDLPDLRPGDLFGRAFTVDKSASYDVYVWLKGNDPLAPDQRAELELLAPTTRMRFVFPAGTPYEEWIAAGSVSLAATERVELHVQGDGALARIALVR